MMCDTSLTCPAVHADPVPAKAGRPSSQPRVTALTCESQETAKVIDTCRSEAGAHPQFGPVVDLAYTRCRATW